MAKKTRRPQVRHRAKPAPKKTTALARREPPARVVIHDPKGELARPPEHLLSEEMSTGALGLVEVKLTAAEEGVLAKDVNPKDVLVKPNGAVYLSHPHYTRWFNEAFGRLGWALVPRSKPMTNGNSVVRYYILYIHGQPVRDAIGEQDYFPTNRDQSYGDAIEATAASALRRVAKRMGMALELWDRAWVDAWLAQHAVRVAVEVEVHGQKKVKYQWRLKDSRPFWNEIRREKSNVHGHDDLRTAKISDAKVKRLWTIIRKRERDEKGLRVYLKARWGVTSTKDLTNEVYDTVCREIEAPGPLRIDKVDTSTGEIIDVPPARELSADEIFGGGREREPGEDDQ